ncbi:hypothetical protein FRC04_003414 [Tulasnella sp. 424]|nr:hypothetical protein FRC04_003414 [Tulasnella sp. 424]
MSMEDDLDYESLNKTLEEVLSLVSHLKIERHSLKFRDEFSHIYGGYAEILCATFEERKVPLSTTLQWRGQVVAVKQLRAWGGDFERTRIAVRLAREIRIWASLHHPNVLPLVGFFLSEDRDVAWLVSSYQSYGNVTQYIQRVRPGFARRLGLLADAAQGLSYLHSLDPPICHGDIKAANVLVTDGLTAVICDFGLSKAVREGCSGLTTSRTLKGSLRHLSPELLDEDPVHTLASDVWAWGCLALEIISERIPYASAKSEQGIILEIARGRLPANISELDLPHNIHTALTLCWNPKPELRPGMSRLLSVITRPRQLWESEILDLSPGEQFVKGDQWSALFKTESVSEVEMDSTLVLGWVQCLRFSEDGSIFAVGHPNGIVQVYDARTGVPLGSLDPFPKKSHKEPVNNICFSPDGRYVAADGNMKIRIWDLVKFKVHQILRCPNLPGDGYVGNPLMLSFVVMGISWTSRLAATSGHDNVLRIWNMDTKSHTVLFQYRNGYNEEEDGMEALTFSPDGALLVVGSHDGSIRIWETSGMSLVQTVEQHLGAIKSLVFSEEGSQLFSCGEDRSIRLWTKGEVALGGYYCSRTIPLNQSADWIDISPDGRWLLSASRYGELRIWETGSGTTQLTIKLESQRSRIGKFHHKSACPLNGGIIAVGDHVGRTTLL